MRQTAFEELRTMRSRASQFNPGNEVPEKNWIYRLFKRLWFNDYGAYAEHFRRDEWQDPRPPSDPLNRPSKSTRPITRMIDPARLQAAYEKARADLLAERTAAGHWEGQLSSSALSTATAISALSIARMHAGRSDSAHDRTGRFAS